MFRRTVQSIPRLRRTAATRRRSARNGEEVCAYFVIHILSISGGIFMQFTDRICRFAECLQLDGGFSFTVCTRTRGGSVRLTATRSRRAHETFRSALGNSVHRRQYFRICSTRPPSSGRLCRDPQLLRTQDDANRHFVYMLIGFASSAAALVWIYRSGIQSRPWLGQGIRFGIAVWMLTSLPWFLTYYAAQPWPGVVVAKQISFEFVTVVLMGIINAGLHRRESGAAQTPSRTAA